MFDISTDKLKISDLWDLVQSNELIMLNSSSMSNIKKSRLFIEKSLESKNGLIYGINTGFGSLCNSEINSNNIQQQYHSVYQVKQEIFNGSFKNSNLYNVNNISNLNISLNN